MRFCPLKRKLRVKRRFSHIAIFQRRSGLSVEAGSGARVQFGPGGRDAAGCGRQAACRYRSGSHLWLPYHPASSRVTGGVRFCELCENVNNFYEK
jgi:hypothetical protein